MPGITLIQPQLPSKDLDRNIKTLYPLGLGYIASYIPPHWDVSVIDEQIEKIDFDTVSDIIGLTTTTLTINRAYEIAAEFRKKGTTVIMGGVHASMCPDEAQQHCDSLVIGDAEGAIQELIKDFEAGNLKRTYYGALSSLDNMAYPKRDVFNNTYSFLPVSTSRGCPFNCNFCAINRFYKGKYRTRDVAEVIDELKGLPKGNDVVFFTDGNIYGYLEKDVNRFKELCRRIAAEHKKKTLNFKYFAGYASVNALLDEEALDLAAKAGCMALFVGFESINPDSLKEMNKTLNLKLGVDSYYNLVQNAQKRRMLVVGEMIVGSDADDSSVLQETKDFLEKINFDILRLQIMQPLPGTRLFEKLEKEDRLYLKNFPEDWRKMANDFIMGVHFEPKNIAPDELKGWVKEVGTKFYSPFNVLKRALKGLMLTKSIKFFLLVLIMNYKSRKTYVNARL